MCAMQFNIEEGEHKPVVLKTPSEILLLQQMIALKQTRSEIKGVRVELRAIAKALGAEVPDVID